MTSCPAIDPTPQPSDRQGAPLDLDAIEARAAEAFPGPWQWCGRNNAIGFDVTSAAPRVRLRDWGVADRRPFAGPGQQRAGLRRADAVFIAHAREDVPALIAEIRRLRRELSARDDAGCA